MSDATLFQIKPYRWRFTETPYNFASKQKRLRSFPFRSRWCYCAKIIAAVAVAFLLVVSSSHLPAALVPGRDRLRQARRLAAAAGVAAAEAADHERPVLSRCAARFTRRSATRRRRDLLTKSRRRTSATLPVFNCASRRRRAEPLTLRSLLVTLWRNLSCPTLRGIWFLTRSSRWRPTMLLLLRRCTFES